MNEKDRVVVAAEYDNDVAANIALGVLRTNGIECELNNEIMANVLALPTAEYTRIRLIVRESDLTTALSLLGASGSQAPLPDDIGR